MKTLIIEKSIKKVCYTMAKISANSSSSIVAYQPILPEKVKELKNDKINK